jgi:hypothetical protein
MHLYNAILSLYPSMEIPEDGVAAAALEAARQDKPACRIGVSMNRFFSGFALSCVRFL